MFDAHFHIIDERFPLVANESYLPSAFGVTAYLRATEGLDITGGAVVSGSFHAFDQDYLIDALDQLGHGFVGVTQLPESVSDEEILRLDAARVRAVRFNLRRGGWAVSKTIEPLARRVHEIAGWHAELYVDARTLPDLETTLRVLPRVGIDHLGLFADGLPALRRHVERGGFVKATGFARLDFDPRAALRELVAINPDAVVFGTDLPSTRAPRPFAPTDVDLIREVLESGDADRVLGVNARRIYLHEP